MKEFGDRNSNASDIAAVLRTLDEPVEYDFVWRQDSEERRVFNEHLNALLSLGRSRPKPPLILQSIEDFTSSVSGTALLDSRQTTKSKGK